MLDMRLELRDAEAYEKKKNATARDGHAWGGGRGGDSGDARKTLNATNGALGRCREGEVATMLVDARRHCRDLERCLVLLQNEERNKQEQATRISNYWERKHDQERRLSLKSTVFSRWRVNAKDTIILRLRRELEQASKKEKEHQAAKIHADALLETSRRRIRSLELLVSDAQAQGVKMAAGAHADVQAHVQAIRREERKASEKRLAEMKAQMMEEVWQVEEERILQVQDLQKELELERRAHEIILRKRRFE
ncbi:hypothetical protein GUITHDRAFT_110267 [Guillardia theta CCMP2712]|uniref:Uncharacterized protein n=1 Tax=Guillardia theta (strain CCMP2712) TaxID=905079 RepID=L1J5L0_GUITC|nr:hypothetical protein GUITHDRAFT_110267 [Guillardia theta CCMP2712]EKX43813.1 hypothetical protein GUITHDRAFT_110267 [Guillardia theta CCMP2712]|eukprot:XP_005830793.1 hypothetical protein GUITHDRAFT_110267 [Guillardia theta CCMP2712]